MKERELGYIVSLYLFMFYTLYDIEKKTDIKTNATIQYSFSYYVYAMTLIHT